ncbi:MAG: transcriptional regulator [Clostridia bacterium BRH_c25]|nr:MAG: transcriptional regulator [Clostridia bacterium BRH_c25]
MQVTLGFGKQNVELDIKDENLLGILMPNEVEALKTGQDEVRRAMENPISSARLKDVVKAGEKVAIITSDITRPMPGKIVLPVVLEELNQAGVADSDIQVIFALGSHRKHTVEEMKYLVGETVYERVECIDLDVDDCVDLGITTCGTPVSVFRPVVEADRRICLGNIEYHYFAGYSGGAKAILPGVCTRDAIQKNHSMMVRDEAKAGAIEDNPVRKDIDEVADLIAIDFIVNVVLNEKKTIIKAVAGHYIDAHREGCRFLDKLYKVRMPEAADIVLVSAGGYPKDINLYQAQKALDNAKHAVRDGGIIILAASCKEGLGEHVFEQWMTTSASSEEMIANIQKNFVLGGHKAAAIGMVLKKAKVFLVSDLDEAFVKSIFLEPYNSVDKALDSAFEALGSDAKVIVMPYGGSTLPFVG